MDGTVGPDILLILVAGLIVVLVWRGPKMLPKIGEAFGKTVKGVRDEVPGAIKGDDADTGESSERNGS